LLLTKKNIKLLRIPVALVAGFFVSCNSNSTYQDKLNQLSNEAPEQMDTIEMVLYQEGSTVAVLKAPQIDRYQYPAKTVFPKGLEVVHYDSLRNVESRLTANRGYYREADQKFEVFQNVIIHNYSKDQEMQTEYLIWEKLGPDKDSVHTNEKVRIFDDNNWSEAQFGIITDTRFSEYSLIKYNGEIIPKTDSLSKK